MQILQSVLCLIPTAAVPARSYSSMAAWSAISKVSYTKNRGRRRPECEREPTGRREIRVKLWFGFRIMIPLGLVYDDVIHALVGGMKQAFAGARNMPKLARPVPLVLSGGTAMPKGFSERFEKILGESDFPVELSEIRMAADPLTTTAKGALVAALSDM